MDFHVFSAFYWAPTTGWALSAFLYVPSIGPVRYTLIPFYGWEMVTELRSDLGSSGVHLHSSSFSSPCQVLTEFMSDQPCLAETENLSWSVPQLTRSPPKAAWSELESAISEQWVIWCLKKKISAVILSPLMERLQRGFGYWDFNKLRILFKFVWLEVTIIKGHNIRDSISQLSDSQARGVHQELPGRLVEGCWPHHGVSYSVDLR